MDTSGTSSRTGTLSISESLPQSVRTTTRVKTGRHNQSATPVKLRKKSITSHLKSPRSAVCSVQQNH
jgi:hypothetical protein